MNSKIYQIGHVVVLALISMVFFPSCEKSEKEKALEEIAQIDGELIELIENGILLVCCRLWCYNKCYGKII